MKKSLDAADEKLSREDEVTAEDTDGDITEIGEEVNDGISERAEELGAPRIFKEGLIGFFKLFDRSGDVGIDFNDELAGIIFFDVGI